MNTESMIALGIAAAGVFVQFGVGRQFIRTAEKKFDTIEKTQTKHGERISRLEGQLDPVLPMRSMR